MTIGFTASSFDLLHAGHVAMLEESKLNCSHLIVGLNVNPFKNGSYPAQGLFERWRRLGGQGRRSTEDWCWWE